MTLPLIFIEPRRSPLVDPITARFRWILWTGITLCLTGLDVVVGLFLVQLGACGAAFRKWKTEPGLSMLAGLFLAISLAMVGLFAFGITRDVLCQKLVPMEALSVVPVMAVLIVQALFFAAVPPEPTSAV